MIHQREVNGDFTSGLNINKWKNVKKWLHFNDIDIHLNGQIQNVQFIWWLCMFLKRFHQWPQQTYYVYFLFFP
jgi:hypothetical protein